HSRPSAGALFPYTTLFRSLGADATDRRRHRGDREAHPGRARRLHLLDEDVLVDRGLAEPAELLRPADAPPALVEELAMEGACERSEEHTSELQSRSDLVCR